MATGCLRERIFETGLPRGWLWVGLLALGAIMHLGTAVLRLDSLFPRPLMLDFMSLYVGSWAFRLDLFPYDPTLETLSVIAQKAHIPLLYADPVSPPLWLYLLMPFTLLTYPTAVWVWLSILLACIATGTRLLVRVGGERGAGFALVWGLAVLSFGPTFLNLTLGQNALVIMLGALFLGRALQSLRARSLAVGGLFWIGAIAAKVFPVLWLAIFPLLRRWRIFGVLLGVALFAFLAVDLHVADVSRHYWTTFLPGRAFGFVERVNLEDQSMTAAIDRLAHSHSFLIPGLSLEKLHAVRWSLPWNMTTGDVTILSAIICGLLGLAVLAAAIRYGREEREGVFYLFVLLVLVVVPHMERYNHVLALPAMAWLWSRGPAWRKIVVLSYFIFGLSRLNHLWALTLPVPWGPAASSFGLYAVLLLGLTVVLAFCRSVPCHADTARL